MQNQQMGRHGYMGSGQPGPGSHGMHMMMQGSNMPGGVSQTAHGGIRILLFSADQKVVEVPQEITQMCRNIKKLAQPLKGGPHLSV